MSFCFIAGLIDGFALGVIIMILIKGFKGAEK